MMILQQTAISKKLVTIQCKIKFPHYFALNSSRDGGLIRGRSAILPLMCKREFTSRAAFEQPKKLTKKLHVNQKADLDKAVRKIIKQPESGVKKTGDLNDVRIYKFKMVKQLMLLAYTYSNTDTITLLALGTHENFYQDLKRIV